MTMTPATSMRRLKVMTVVGTRPEIIRLARTIARLDDFTDHILVHTGQNFDFELNEIFFRDLGVRRPDHFLDAAGDTPTRTIANVIVAVDDLLARERPDAMLVLGDTNSCMAVLPAKRHKVPVFHMEAGNRCYDQRVPEEINRKLVDHSADVNLAYSDVAKANLLREGLPPDLTFKTGSPMFEVLTHHARDIAASDVLERLGLVEGGYFLASVHREENVDAPERLHMLAEVLSGIVASYGLPVIFSTHPRTQKRLDAHGIAFDPKVRLLKPLGFFDYNRLQIGARATLSDSGTISEESSILNFPAVNLRETHERQEAAEEGAVMMVGMNRERVLQALAILEQQTRGPERTLRLAADYAVPNVSEKVVRFIHSYTDYVNRVVWKRY
jgi:UDP-N-acetyl-L-fucosamine synthase